MTQDWWETYAQQMEASGAADLPDRLPENVQALLEEMGLTTLDPSAYTDLGLGQTAQMLVDRGVWLVAVEGQSVGDRAVHRILLENEVVVLEGAVLAHVPVGKYELFAAPVPFGGCDGAPCRAVLKTIDKKTPEPL